MLASVWDFLKTNKDALGLTGSAFAAVVAAAWAVYTFKVGKTDTGSAEPPNVRADRGSVAAGGDISGNVTIGSQDKSGG